MFLETNSSLSYEAVMVSKVFQLSLQNKCQTSLKLLLNKALLSYTLMIMSREQIVKLIEQLYLIGTKYNLELAADILFMLLKIKLLGHETGYNAIKPKHSKIAVIHKIPTPTGNFALMSFICTLIFHTKFNEKLCIYPKPF